MNITLDLLHGVAIVKNKGVIPITSDPFTLSVCSKDYVRENLFVTVANDGHNVTAELIDGIAVLPSEVKKAGVMRITIRKIINGEILQTWQAEDILLRELEGGYEPIPQITALTEKVAALAAAVAELKKIIIEREEF